jgi:hypothetical protein
MNYSYMVIILLIISAFTAPIVLLGDKKAKHKD